MPKEYSRRIFESRDVFHRWDTEVRLGKFRLTLSIEAKARPSRFFKAAKPHKVERPNETIGRVLVEMMLEGTMYETTTGSRVLVDKR